MLNPFIKNTLILVLFLGVSFMGFSQMDTLKLKDNTVIKGQVKTLNQGVLTIKTSYSDSDFNVTFKDVVFIHLQKKSLILLTQGRRRFGYLTTNKKGLAQIISTNGEIEQFQISEIVALNEVDDKFWNRFIVYIDVGLNISKANNLKQFSIAGEVHYVDKSWMMDGTVSVLNSTQDDVGKTERTDATANVYRLLKNGKWYLLANTSFLSSTEQSLTGRLTPSLGAGRFLKNTENYYWGLGLGVNYNIENYVDTSLNKTSTESFISTTLNLFNFTDITLVSTFKLLPSLSQKGRVRIDFDNSLKYDLPSDFYIKAGFSLNYDNQPAVVGNDWDYVITSGVGWKFN